MTRTDSPASWPGSEFPRLEMDPAQRRQIRELLVRQVRSAADTPKATLGRRFSSRNFAVPAAALAVVLAITGTGFVVRAVVGGHDRSQTHSPAGRTTGSKRASLCRPGIGPIGDPHAAPVSSRPAPFTEGDGLRYLIPTPTHWNLDTALLRRLHCTDGRTPVATYVKRDGDTITEAFTVFSGRPKRPFPSSPNSVARVTVRSRPGLVHDNTELTWTEPNGRSWEIWSAQQTASSAQAQTRSDLVAIAGQLHLRSGTATWPAATTEGYTRIDMPPLRTFKEGSQQLVWMAYYSSPVTISSLPIEILVSRDAWPWQGVIAVWGGVGRLVEVNGLQGFLTTGPLAIPKLYLGTADGTQLVISGPNPLQIAQQLTPVRADDPRLKLDPKAAAHWGHEN